MPEQPSRDSSPGTLLSDPRVDGDHLRCLVADEEPTVLVGVVHDHPASVARVERTIVALAPAVVGVELPRLALPLFATHGRRSLAADCDGPGDEEADERAHERGDERAHEGAAATSELAAALAAAEDVGARRVPVDTIGRSFARSLWRATDGTPSLPTLRRVARGAAAATGHAVSCRLAATLGSRWPLAAGPGERFDHDVSPRSPPERQASHEERQRSRSVAVLQAIERPAAEGVLDEVRERTMARTIARHRTAGGTVAVVGFDHLDDVADHLRDRGFESPAVDAPTLDRLWE